MSALQFETPQSVAARILDKFEALLGFKLSQEWAQWVTALINTRDAEWRYRLEREVSEAYERGYAAGHRQGQP